MHALDKPATMQDAPAYLDPAAEIADFLGKFLARAEENGIPLESMVCDPGFGFGKTPTHNLSLLRDFTKFQTLGRPMLVGLSRKSFLNLVGGRELSEYTSQWAHLWATAQGAAIWRVHDVPAAAQSGARRRRFRAGQPSSMNPTLVLIAAVMRGLLEILILSVGIYWLWKLFRGTRGARVLAGFGFLLAALSLIAYALDLKVIHAAARHLARHPAYFAGHHLPARIAAHLRGGRQPPALQPAPAPGGGD